MSWIYYQMNWPSNGSIHLILLDVIDMSFKSNIVQSLMSSSGPWLQANHLDAWTLQKDKNQMNWPINVRFAWHNWPEPDIKQSTAFDVKLRSLTWSKSPWCLGFMSIKTRWIGPSMWWHIRLIPITKDDLMLCGSHHHSEQKNKKPLVLHQWSAWFAWQQIDFHY